jgi:hypothetical protein
MSLEVIVFILGSLSLGVFIWHSSRSFGLQGQLKASPPQEERILDAAFDEGLRLLDLRVEKLERGFNDWLEQVEERIERGNKVYQRARAAERRLEEQRESEGLYESEAEVSLGDGEGGPGEGVPHMPQHLEDPGDSRPVHLQVADQIAAQAALEGFTGAFD